MFDPLALLDTVIPFLVLVGISVLTMTLAHLGLTISGNRFQTEISTVLGLAVFVGAQLVLGITDVAWLLFMLFLVTPLMVYEAVRSPSGSEKTLVLLDTFDECEDALCFSVGGRFVALGALKITGLPIQSKKPESKQDIDDELKILHPLWENSKQSETTYTIEARVIDGLVELTVFVLSKGKDWLSSIDNVKQGREIAETWLNQMDYSYDVLGTRELEGVY